MVNRQSTFAVSYKLKRNAKEDFIDWFCHINDKRSKS